MSHPEGSGMTGTTHPEGSGSRRPEGGRGGIPGAFWVCSGLFPVLLFGAVFWGWGVKNKERTPKRHPRGTRRKCGFFCVYVSLLLLNLGFLGVCLGNSYGWNTDFGTPVADRNVSSQWAKHTNSDREGTPRKGILVCEAVLAPAPGDSYKAPG